MSAATFAVWAVLLVGSAVGALRARNLVHAVFWLAAVLLSTAGVFVALDAGFLAAIQVLLYTGGVITLMLFGVMLTQRGDAGVDVPNPTHRHVTGGLTALAVLGLLLSAIWSTDAIVRKPVALGSAKALGVSILSTHLLAFEALSVLLLAAMIGAIVLARRSDP